MSVDPHAARDLLAFYLEAGVDAVLEEEPVDRFADTEAIPPPGRERSADDVRRVGVAAHQNPARSALRAEQPPLSGEGKGLVFLPPDAAAAEAREAARQAQNLDQLRAMLEGFEGCGLKAMRAA